MLQSNEIDIANLVRPTPAACRQLNNFKLKDTGVVISLVGRSLAASRTIAYVLWNGEVAPRPIAVRWLERVVS